MQGCAVTAAFDAGQRGTQHHILRRQPARQRRDQIGAVQLQIGGAIGLACVAAIDGLQQGAAVGMAQALFQRFIRRLGQGLAKAQPLQAMNGIGRQRNAGAHIFKGPGPFVDDRAEPGLFQRQRRDQPADAAANDSDARARIDHKPSAPGLQILSGSSWRFSARSSSPRPASWRC